MTAHAALAADARPPTHAMSFSFDRQQSAPALPASQYGEDNTTVPWMAGMYVPPGDSTTTEEEGIPVRQLCHA